MPLTRDHSFLAMLLFGFLAVGTASSHGQSISEQYLLAAANQDRAANSLRPVRLDPLLSAAAFAHAREMAAHRTISHRFQGEADLAERAANAGVQFSLVTENVAEASNSALIHDLWMKSSGHRANLLDAQVDSIGIAVLAVGGQLYAVEDFARTVERLSFHDQESDVAILLESSGVAILPDPRDARLTCLKDNGYVGAAQPWFVMRYTAASLKELPSQLKVRLATGKYRSAAVGACTPSRSTPFSSYSIAVLLYP
jgi:hypothetical protein